MFGALAIDTALEPGYAYVLTAERPGVSWEAKKESAEGDEIVFERERRVEVGAGPLAPPPPTLGEAMLMNLTRSPGEAAARAAVILIPRVPGRGGAVQ